MTMTVATNQDGDNAEGSVITNESTSTPDVALSPDVQSTTESATWNWCMQTFDGCLNTTPEFTFPLSTYDAGRNFNNREPYYSYNQLDWVKFDNIANPVDDLICSHNSAFTSDKVQIAFGRPYTWTKMRDLVDNTWKPHAWTSPTASGDSDFVMWTNPADTDLSIVARPIPAQEACGFKILHPNFRSGIRRKLVIATGNHVGEYMGEEVFIAFVSHLLSAEEDSSDARHAYAFEVLKHYDVYCYPMINPCHYVSTNRVYAGLLGESDIGSDWNDTNKDYHLPFKNLILADIDSSCDAMLDFHSTKSAALAETYYQITTNPDDYNGDDASYLAIYGSNRYWYHYYMTDIIATTNLQPFNNLGAMRQWSRDSLGSLVGTTIEIGQDGGLTETDSDNCAKAVMYMLMKLTEAGRTSVPRPTAPQRVTW